MRILAIETATLQGSIALVDTETGLLEERSFQRGMVHGKLLAPLAHSLLEKAGLRIAELELLAVDTGPGSYTGLRVGLAFAKSICYALGIPLAGVLSLEAMARRLVELDPYLPEGAVLRPVLDAKWGQIYTASYLHSCPCLKPASPIESVHPEQFRAEAGAVVFGDAVDLLPPQPSITLRREVTYPLARDIADLGDRAFRAGRRDDPLTLVPVYLRPTAAELNFLKRQVDSKTGDSSAH